MKRFWSKVRKSSNCWIWTGSLSTHGKYGQFSANGTCVKAHRFAFALANGPVRKGVFICHTCDNPACVRPSHLYLGTPKTNVADMLSRGRGYQLPALRGEASPSAKLTRKQVTTIRRKYTGAFGELTQLAQKYGVTKQAIAHVVKRRNWRSVA